MPVVRLALSDKWNFYMFVQTEFLKFTQSMKNFQDSRHAPDVLHQLIVLFLKMIIKLFGKMFFHCAIIKFSSLKTN